MYLHYEECFIDKKRIQSEFVSGSTFTGRFSRFQGVPVEVRGKRQRREKKKKKERGLPPKGWNNKQTLRKQTLRNTRAARWTTPPR
jgi:hypothetical protein